MELGFEGSEIAAEIFQVFFDVTKVGLDVCHVRLQLRPRSTLPTFGGNMHSAIRDSARKSLPAESDSRVVPVGYIERRIYRLREQNLTLDSDLADLYQVTTGNLNLAVRRNVARFPVDFMFQMTKEESDSLLLQSAIAKIRTWRPTHLPLRLYRTRSCDVVVGAQ